MREWEESQRATVAALVRAALVDERPTTASVGQIAILEITEPPGAEAARHVHHKEDEGFWVLEGGVTFEVGGATAGDYAFGPRNVPHSYRVGPDGCRMLFIVTPAGYGGGPAGALLLGGEYVPPIEQSRARSQPRRG